MEGEDVVGAVVEVEVAVVLVERRESRAVIHGVRTLEYSTHMYMDFKFSRSTIW